MFEEKVLETIKKYNLIENGDRIVLGISGGPDSISLLNSLLNLRDNRKIDFVPIVAHINHGLRKNANIDEKFVESYCNKKNVKFYVLHAKVREQANLLKRGLEETGRMVRYEFFDEIMKKENCNKIAIAHNANDNVETMLMNEIRGSGLYGLKGIEAKKDVYIRPLIEIERKEIEEYCESENLNPRHDESNDDNTYTRNKIRNVLIPYIRDNINPNIIESMTRLALIARDELDLLDKLTLEKFNEVLIEKTDNYLVLNLKKFNSLDKALEKRIILYSITTICGSSQGIEKVHIEDIVKMCNNNIGNKYLTPNKNLKIVMKNKNIYIEHIK